MTYRMEASKHVDKDLAYARRNAVASGATIIITRQGRALFEVSPKGDVTEAPAAPLRTTLAVFAARRAA